MILEENNIVGGISESLHDNSIVGWLLCTDDLKVRDAILCINELSLFVVCNMPRANPKKFVDRPNNGFRVEIDSNICSHLKNINKIVLKDKETGREIYKCTMKLTTEQLQQMNHRILSGYKSKLKRIVGKLNSTFKNLKIKGWIYSSGQNDVYRSVIVRLSNGMEYTSIADKYRVDKKHLNNGRVGFSITIPIDVIKSLPDTFDVSLFDQETMYLVDSIEYRNTCFFTPKNFSDFLLYSMINPVVYAPFDKNLKRTFAFTENIVKLLSSNNMSCLVSVIMPVYNRSTTILDAIESVLNQTYKNLELIIVDDCSVDGTYSILKSQTDPRIVLHRNDTNMGCSYSRNIAVKNSRGKYLFYLDSDNTWDPRYISTMLGAFEKLPDASALYSGQYLYEKNIDNVYAIRFASFNKALLENRNYIDLNSFCQTRESFDSVGGFDPCLRRWGDYDLIIKISKKYSVYSVPVFLTNYFTNKVDNSITSLESIDASDFYHNRIKEVNDICCAKRMSVTAIIPNYESLEEVKKCIDSLMIAGCDEIIVIDNKSSPETIVNLEEFCKNFKIKLIRNDINYGFTYAVNQGIKIANKNNDILIVNNDSVYSKHSIEEMRKYAYLLDNVGLIVPRQVLYGGDAEIPVHVPYANCEFDCDVNLSMHFNNIHYVPLFSNGRYVELSYATFFSVYLKRDVYEKVGGLDAEHGRHYRSDFMYCDLIRHVWKLKIYYVGSAVVYHKNHFATKILNQGKKNKSVIDNTWERGLREKLGYCKKQWEYF